MNDDNTREIIDCARLFKLQKILANTNPAIRNNLRSLNGCNRRPAFSTARSVDICINTSSTGRKTANYLGLQHCGSSWSCPACSAKSIREMRVKLTSIIHNIKQRLNLVAVMITFTIPHNSHMSADEVYTNLRNGRARWSSFQQRYLRNKGFYPNSFTSYECRYSKVNGWHFHCHCLYFMPLEVANSIMNDDFQAELAERWKTNVLAVVPDMIWDRVNVSLPVYISRHIITNGDYLAKEMCKRTNHSTHSIDPFELLDSDDPADHDLFLEFALATKGRVKFAYGKKLAQFADSEETLKKNLLEITDVDDTSVVASFTFSDWLLLTEAEYTTGIPHRTNILIAALKGGGAEILHYCQQMKIPSPIVHAIPIKINRDAAA